MFTTDPFSIRTYRGMGEYDPPGTYRDRGVEGGARTAREDVFEAELRQVRAERAGSLPLRLLFQCRLSLLEEKECIGVLRMM
mgnify:CR=1 FL=1